MALEFHVEPDSDDTVQMYIEDVTVPGVYRAQEIGGGITEEYKAETQQQSGGNDEADSPPAARISIEAYVEESTWEQLDTLRDRETPFEVQIGPFAFEEMGIRSMEAITRADETGSTQLNMTLQEFREVTIQERNVFDQGGGGGGEGGNFDAQGPDAGWVDEDNDGVDDETGEEIPDMERIPLSPGQEWSHHVGDGEAWGRKVIDSTEGNAFPGITTSGSGWALQDIGIAGEVGSPSRNYTPFGPRVDGGEAIMSNIYLADGAPMYSGDRGSTGIWVDNSSSGTLIFENINVQNWPDNGIYGSPPQGSATVIIRDSYAANNGHANYRLFKGQIENSVAVLDGGGHSDNGPRCFWMDGNGPVEITGSELAATNGGNAIVGSGPKGSGTVNVSDTGIEGDVAEAGGTINISGRRDPDPQAYADGIPGSPTDAAAGSGGGGGGNGDGGDGS